MDQISAFGPQKKPAFTQIRTDMLKGMVRPKIFYQQLEIAQKNMQNMYLSHLYQDWKWVKFSETCVT